MRYALAALLVYLPACTRQVPAGKPVADAPQVQPRTEADAPGESARNGGHATEPWLDDPYVASQLESEALDAEVFGFFVPVVLPSDPKRKIDLLVSILGRQSRSVGTPLGLDINRASIEILRCGRAALPSVRRALGDADAQKASFLLCVLGYFSDHDSFGEVAAVALKHSCTEQGRSAIWALPRIDAPMSINVLVELLYADDETSDDAKTYRIPVTHALSKATGLSFPRPVFHPGRPEPVAVWEDLAKWREWALANAAQYAHELPPSVAAAVERRRLRRRTQEGVQSLRSTDAAVEGEAGTKGSE